MIEIFKLPFMQEALLASLLVAAVCSFLGVYVVLRRIVFVGAALAQVSSAGVALALILGMSSPYMSLAAALVGVALFSIPLAERRIPREAVIGVGYVLASAAAILLVAHSPRGEAHVLNVLFGNVLTVDSGQIMRMIIAFAVVGLTHWLFAKQFLATGFDPEFAAAMGYRSQWWDFWFYLSIGLAISAAIRVSGALLVFGLLVLPATTALLVAGRMAWAMILSMAAGVLSAFFGLYLSFVTDLPTGPTIIACAGALFLLAAAFRRVIQHGIMIR